MVARQCMFVDAGQAHAVGSKAAAGERGLAVGREKVQLGEGDQEANRQCMQVAPSQACASSCKAGAFKG